MYTEILSEICLLGDGDGSVALVGLDGLAALDLLVGVAAPDDEPLGVVDDGEDGEALVGAELAAPAGGDGEVAALLGGAVGLRGGAALLGVDGELAPGRLDVLGVGVDVELEDAAGVVALAVALEALDRPLGGVGHHRLGVGLGGAAGGEGGGRGGGGEGEEAGQLHVCGGKKRKLLFWKSGGCGGGKFVCLFGLSEV